MTGSRKKPSIKFLRTRLLLDDIYSVIRGWYFRMPPGKVQSSAEFLDGHVLSEINIKMKWRDDLKEINHSRFHNMGLGCQLVNQVMLRPGEVFSLRRFFGGTTEEQGFQKGPMFIRGRIDYIAGGGACLISTLLFNAAMKSNLRILEKHNHSTDLWGEERFIELGLDATYVYGRKDLKFKNTHEASIYIVTELSMDDLMLSCRFISPKPLSCRVSVMSEVLQELRPTDNPVPVAPAEERPYRKGWVVRTKRMTNENENNPGKITYTKKELYKPFLLP
jgi:vancomycin resistance protein YoaR